MLLKFANIGLPAKISLIYERDRSVSFISSFVICMSVEPGLRLTRHVDLGLQLNVVLLNWFRLDSIFLSNYSKFDRFWVCLYWDGLFHLIVCFLGSIKTRNFVIGHSIDLIGDCRNSLNKSNHCLVAFGVEFVVVSCFKLIELSHGLVTHILKWVLKIWQKSQSIFKLNFERLIIDCRPSTSDVACITLCAIFAKCSLNLEFIHQFDFPEVLFVKSELLIIWNKLEFIGELVRADLLCFEEVYLVSVLWHIKMPYAVQLSTQAVHGLVCLYHNIGLIVI
jgi:hypothetical protein